MDNSVQKLIENTLVDKLRPLVLQIHEEQNLKKLATGNVSDPILPIVVNTLPSFSYAHNPHDGQNITGSVAPNYVTSNAIKTDVTQNPYQTPYAMHNALTSAQAYRAENYPNVQTPYYQM